MSRKKGININWDKEAAAIQDMFNEGRSVAEVAAYYAVQPAWVYKLVYRYHLSTPKNPWNDDATRTKHAAMRAWDRTRHTKLKIFRAQHGHHPDTAALTIHNILWNHTCPITGAMLDYHSTKGEACYPVLHLSTRNVVSQQALAVLQAAKDDHFLLHKAAAFLIDPPQPAQLEPSAESSTAPLPEEFDLTSAP